MSVEQQVREIFESWHSKREDLITWDIHRRLVELAGLQVPKKPSTTFGATPYFLLVVKFCDALIERSNLQDLREKMKKEHLSKVDPLRFIQHTLPDLYKLAERNDNDLACLAGVLEFLYCPFEENKETRRLEYRLLGEDGSRFMDVALDITAGRIRELIAEKHDLETYNLKLGWSDVEARKDWTDDDSDEDGPGKEVLVVEELNKTWRTLIKKWRRSSDPFRKHAVELLLFLSKQPLREAPNKKYSSTTEFASIIQIIENTIDPDRSEKGPGSKGQDKMEEDEELKKIFEVIEVAAMKRNPSPSSILNALKTEI